MSALKINSKQTEANLINFIKNEIKKAGLKGAVIGLSGGIDSACVAYLTVKAIGKNNVLGLMLPYESSTPESIEDAKLVAKNLDIKYQIIEITPMIDSYFKDFPHASNIRRGNKMARERMSILYDYAKEHEAMVVGTGNKTESFLGYGTIFGDMACGIAPLAKLFKTQVRELARYMNVPHKIINKVPSADLWEGQTDEGELGMTYADADNILHLLIDKEMDVGKIIKNGYKPETVRKITKLIKENEFKTRLPATPNA